MLPARAILPKEASGWNFLSLPGSRFQEVAEFRDINHIVIDLQFDSQLLSTITYACYLVYKLPENASVFEGIVIVSFETRSRAHTPVEHHEVIEDIGRRTSFEDMRRIADQAVTPLSYITQSQLLLLFMKGMLVDDGKTWFSVNKIGQHCELISASKCISTSDNVDFTPNTVRSSRFQHLLRHVSTQDLRLKVKTQFLSPNVTYIINLVYDYNGNRPHHNSLRIPFKYKLEEMRQYVTSCVACVGEGGWRRTELFQFTSTKNEHHFDILFSSEIRSSFSISIEGVELCPVDFEKDENKADHLQPTDIDWGERLPRDYIHIVKWSKDIDESMTRKEVYFVLRKGLYINNSQQWFSISKKSKQRLMLPARAVLPNEGSKWNFLSLPGSRFQEVAESRDSNHLVISLEFDSQLLSTGIMYACYLIYKLPENASVFEGIIVVSFDTRAHVPVEHHVYLVTPPHTPIIELSPGERPPRTRKIKGHPKLRKDGWMEIQVCELYNGSITPHTCSESGYLESLNEWNFTGLLVQGIELRPAKVSWKHSNYIKTHYDEVSKQHWIQVRHWLD
ncbi:hypothetical protein M8C21_006102 [Ambrosia artemisiifolia]|uniref:Uncharacterized protein n=1 Tax=Ambrosia artemisiifolia TaxID=4212 RepID=A0AAD5G8B7_AMBAR|nr:hypothetical protein M8C21_006102 [Ambrosia artemisiifolia]